MLVLIIKASDIKDHGEFKRSFVKIDGFNDINFRLTITNMFLPMTVNNQSIDVTQCKQKLNRTYIYNLYK